MAWYLYLIRCPQMRSFEFELKMHEIHFRLGLWPGLTTLPRPISRLGRDTSYPLDALGAWNSVSNFYRRFMVTLGKHTQQPRDALALVSDYSRNLKKRSSLMPYKPLWLGALPIYLTFVYSCLLLCVYRLQDDPPPGVSASPTENNIMLWNAIIFGSVWF